MSDELMLRLLPAQHTLLAPAASPLDKACKPKPTIDFLLSCTARALHRERFLRQCRQLMH